MNDPRVGKKTIRGKRSTTVEQTVDYDLDNAFELFYNVKRAEGMRDRTLADYKTHWRYFREWVDARYPDIKLREVTQSVLREYVMYMANGRTKYEGVDNRVLAGVTLSPSTVSIRLRTLRTMFNFWSRERMLDVNPASNLRPPKKDEEDKETFTDDQIRLLLMAPDTNTFAGMRDQTLMYLLADCGLRINEALNLTTEHFDVKSRTITLPASMNKNRRPREVPVSLEVIRMIFELINENKSYFDTDYIFITNYGEPLKADHFRKRLHQYAVNTGLDGKIQVSPHRFRDYFCTNYLLNGGDVFTLRRIVAHADIKTTQGYVKVSNEQIRQQHTQFSPITNLGMHKIVNRRK